MHWMREYHKQVLLGLKFLLSRGLPLVLVSAATAGVFLLKTPNSAKQASAPGARDPNATVGQYEGKSEAEIQAELDKVVQGRDVQHLHQPGYPDDQRQSGSGAAGGKYSGQSPSDERHFEPG